MIIFPLMLAASFMASAQNVIDRNGQRQGHWLKTDKNGNKVYEGDFENGHEVGLFQYYYPNGALKIKNVFSDNGKSCDHEAYDEDGHKLASGRFVQKNRHGKWLFFNEQGLLVKKCDYNMGVKEGEEVIFDKNGDTAEVSHWRDNRRHGRWWKRLGKSGFITASYVNGGVEGLMNEYDNDGRPATIGHYANGLRHGSFQYFEQGVLSVEESYQQGILTDRKIRIMQPEAAFIPTSRIVCLIPQGKDKVLVFTEQGDSIVTFEPNEVLFARLGNDRFAFANKKSRVMVSTDRLMGLKKDSEGRDVLDLDPAISIDIFPDEDCLKLINALQRDGVEE